MIATKPLQEVIILGAGPSGLSIARCLLDKGIKPLLLEASDAVAASWRKRHPQLSLNTVRCRPYREKRSTNDWGAL